MYKQTCGQVAVQLKTASSAVVRIYPSKYLILMFLLHDNPFAQVGIVTTLKYDLLQLRIK